MIGRGSTDAAQTDGPHAVAGRIGLLGHGIYNLVLTLLCGQLLVRASADVSAEGAIAAVADSHSGWCCWPD